MAAGERRREALILRVAAPPGEEEAGEHPVLGAGWQARGRQVRLRRPDTSGGDSGGRTRDQGRTVDASAPWAEEGRGKLRKASGSRTQALIRGSPNGATRRDGVPSPAAEHIGGQEAEPGN